MVGKAKKRVQKDSQITNVTISVIEAPFRKIRREGWKFRKNCNKYILGYVKRPWQQSDIVRNKGLELRRKLPTGD